MTSHVVLPLPVLIPLVGASIALLVGRNLRLQRAVSASTCAASVVAAGALLRAVLAADGAIAVHLGGWDGPFAITMVADRLSAAMVMVATLMLLAVLGYAAGQLSPEVERLFFHPVYLVMAAGVSLSFLAGDLFNLFVAFEIMLIASYVLITLGATRAQLRSGMTYVVINLVASTLFVVTVALLYASTGTVNMAELAGRLTEVPAHLRSALGLLLLVVFGIKAGLFPLFFWLPDSYPTAPPAVTAVFAALLTKVGVYSIIRTQTLLFGQDGPSTLLLFLAGATMLIGVLGAVSQGEIRRILSFHIVSQIGYMILGLGLFSVAGLAGGILYILHHIVVKTTLFCAGGAVEHAYGTGRLEDLGGTATRAPLLALLFALPALSLAGLPPFSGFVAKFALAQATVAEGRWMILIVALLVSLLTLYSMTKIWAGAFWGERPLEPIIDPPDVVGSPPSGGGGAVAVAVPAAATVVAPVAPVATGRVPLPMLVSTAGLVIATLGIAVFAQPLYTFSAAAAADLLAPAGYLTAVLGR